jgi:hypothetical protein
MHKEKTAVFQRKFVKFKLMLFGASVLHTYEKQFFSLLAAEDSAIPEGTIYLLQ